MDCNWFFVGKAIEMGVGYFFFFPIDGLIGFGGMREAKVFTHLYNRGGVRWFLFALDSDTSLPHLQ